MWKTPVGASSCGARAETRYTLPAGHRPNAQTRASEVESASSTLSAPLAQAVTA